VLRALEVSALDSIHRLLLVEDDLRLANSTREYLEDNGYSVLLEHRGDTVKERILQDLPDLVILDLMLPGLDGLEVCKDVRPVFDGPILMLTARDDEIEQVVGLEVGADDYVIKPVVPRVLLARIRALLRRDQRAHENASTGICNGITFGKLYLEYNRRIVTLKEQVITCTEVEFQLLWLLATHAGKILNREFLYTTLNGHEYDGLDRSIDIRVSKLRKIFEEDPANPTRIKTVRGKGYVFIETTWN